MKFKKNDLKFEEHRTVYDKIIGHRRWSVDHERVFEHDGRFFRTLYSVGATEGQDERPYEYEPDDIECEEVFPRQVTSTVYLSQKEMAVSYGLPINT